MMGLFMRLEAMAVFFAAVLLNILMGGNWWLFAAFAIVPDLGLVGYLRRDKTLRWPAILYNVTHTYAAPLLLALALWIWQPNPAGDSAPIYLTGWAAHIAVDRFFGFGFKSVHSFHDTHIQRAAKD